MIDYLRGTITVVDADYIVLDVRDVGYRIFVANPYSFAAKRDEAVTVYIHYHVREDATLLFGFADRAEQTLFRKLLDVSGIGPRVALGVLSAGHPEAIITAIQQENYAFLIKLPGIGRKTAQRMVLDLKDKLVGGENLLQPMSVAEYAAYQKGSAKFQGDGTAWPEAREGLEALGYTAAELDKAWTVLEETITADESVDALMKRVLQHLFKG